MKDTKTNPGQTEEIKKMVWGMCICEGCPTYKDCSKAGGKREKGFCVFGKSKCIKDAKGCICGGCPVTKKLMFKHMYYCMRGTEKEQS